MEKLLDLFINFINLFHIACIIEHTEKAVVLRFGKFHRILEPGFHFIFPFAIEQVISHEVVKTTRKLDAQTLETQDGYQLVVTPIVTFSIFDVHAVLLELEDALTVLEDNVYSAVTNGIMESTLDNCMTKDFAEEISNTVISATTPFGFDVEKVTFADMAQIRTIRIISDGETVIPDEEF